VIANDVVRTYRNIHSWIGIVCGLALFIAFYAGALTMFEDQIRRWAAGPSPLPPVPSLEQTAELVRAAQATNPVLARAYRVHATIGPDTPARITWTETAVDDDDHSSMPITFGAAFDENGEIIVARVDMAPVAQLIDGLHQQVGLPFSHEWAMPITGTIALAYFVALISGLIVLLPSLIKDVFALRIGPNLKRMWLDVHNALGVFSLPFHLIMALTTIVFAFHDVIYDVQDKVVYDGKINEQWAQMRPPPTAADPDAPLLNPAALVRHINEQAPGFTTTTMDYRAAPDGSMTARVRGYDNRYAMRGPNFGQASIDPYNGRFLETDYLPGHQSGWATVITTFFTLHFGSFGGDVVRWLYFLLGLAGAVVFYTGNLIWIESHRKRSRAKDSFPRQTKASYTMGNLSIGGALGCVAGISTTLAASRWLPELVADAYLWHEFLYYLVFLGAIAWAFLRGPARGGVELLWLASITTAFIPLSSLLQPDFHPGGSAVVVDLVALSGCIVLGIAATATRRRSVSAPADSIWFDDRHSSNAAGLPKL